MKKFLLSTMIYSCLIVLVLTVVVYSVDYIRHSVQYTGAHKSYYRDSGLYVYSSANGQLDLVADTEVQIAATTIDLNGVTAFSTSVCDTNAFTTTATTDTVTIAGVVTGSVFIVSGMKTSAVDQQDVLEWEAIAGKLVVHRLAAGESGLKYSWFWVK